MPMRTLIIGAVSAVLVSSLAVIAHTSARAAEEKTSSTATLKLHLALRLDESGEPKLYFDMPASDEFLRQLINGQEKHLAVFLTATKDIPYGDVVKAIDRLGSLGLHRISLDTNHEKAAR